MTKNRKELQALTSQLLAAQEQERRRISRDLHDDLNQRLAVLALKIQTAQRGLTETDPTYITLQDFHKDVSDLSDDVRHLAYQLHPSILDDLGLEVPLKSFVNDFAKWEGIPVSFSADHFPRSIPPDIATPFYRIGQEGLRNIAKHAQASKAVVKLSSLNGGLTNQSVV